MTSVRVHIRIAAPADVVWKVVSDAANVAAWFPAVARATAEGTSRDLHLHNGPVLHDEIVTNDQVLRRFQHSIRSGLPIESHLATIDVLDDRDGALVIYGADVEPAAAASMMAGLVSEALDGLKRFVEAGA